MPLLLLFLLAGVTLGWFETRREACPCEVELELQLEAEPADLADYEPGTSPEEVRTWQAECVERFESARAEAALLTGIDAFTGGAISSDGSGGRRQGRALDRGRVRTDWAMRCEGVFLLVEERCCHGESCAC